LKKNLRAQEEPKSLPPDAMPFLGSKYAKIAFAAGGAYSAPPDSLAGLRGSTSKRRVGRGRGGEGRGGKSYAPFLKFLDPPLSSY